MKLRTSFLRFPLSCIRYSLVALAGLTQAEAVTGNRMKANNNDNLSLGSSWFGGSAPSSTDRAIFQSLITGPITSAIGGDMAVYNLWILSAGGDITINGTAGKSLTVYDGGIDMRAATCNLNLNGLSYVLGLGQTWDVSSGMAITTDASTVISGTAATNLTKSGDGTLTLNGQNTFLGQFVIKQGTVNLGHAFNTLDDSITVHLSDAAATLAIGANSDTVATVTAVSGATITGSTGTLSATSAFNFAGNVVSAKLGGAAAVAITGTSVLSGVNSYTGGTTVTDGTLLVSNTSGSGTGTGAVTVASGATLGGTGMIAGDVNVSGTLAPGASIGFLAVGGDLTLANDSAFSYEMNSSGITAGDLLVVNATGGGTYGLSIGTNVALTLTDLMGGTFAANTTLSLIEYLGEWDGGTFIYGTNELFNGEAFSDTYGNHWTISYDATSGGDNYAPQRDDSHFVTLSNTSAIPEPGSLFALGCLIGSGAFFRSRRI